MSSNENPKVTELPAQWLKQEDRPPSTVKEIQRAVDRFMQVMGRQADQSHLVPGRDNVL